MTGIIPAYAGSTGAALGGQNPCGDHPRVCGEHMMPTDRLVTVRGSSPRMRGALTLYGAAVITPGIIPAYAGSTRCRREGLC